MLMFTYGTLKRGYNNHFLLSSAAYKGEAVTKPLYRIYDCGHFPCLVKDEKGLAIHGELYEISPQTRSVLDRLEGVPHLYLRDFIEIEKHQNIEVSAYFFNGDISGYPDCGNEWPRK